PLTVKILVEEVPAVASPVVPLPGFPDSRTSYAYVTFVALFGLGVTVTVAASFVTSDICTSIGLLQVIGVISILSIAPPGMVPTEPSFLHSKIIRKEPVKFVIS